MDNQFHTLQLFLHLKWHFKYLRQLYSLKQSYYNMISPSNLSIFNQSFYSIYIQFFHKQFPLFLIYSIIRIKKGSSFSRLPNTFDVQFHFLYNFILYTFSKYYLLFFTFVFFFLVVFLLPLFALGLVSSFNVSSFSFGSQTSPTFGLFHEI